MFSKETKKEMQPETVTITRPDPPPSVENSGLTPVEQRLAPSPELAKEIHDSIFPPEQDKLPSKLTTEEKEKLADMASKTNIVRSIAVSLKSIASDVKAILVLLVWLCGAVFGLVFTVSLLVFALMGLISVLAGRFAYMFFSSEKSGGMGTVERLRDAFNKTIVGR